MCIGNKKLPRKIGSFIRIRQLARYEANLITLLNNAKKVVKFVKVKQDGFITIYKAVRNREKLNFFSAQ